MTISKNYCSLIFQASDGERARYRCVRCGKSTPWVRSAPETIRLECPVVVPPQMPGVVKRVAKYAEAVFRWNLKGRPTRSDELVNLISEKCCKPCSYYNGQSCRACGCRVRSVEEERRSGLGTVMADAMLNKIRMETEDCPIRCSSCGRSKWEHLNEIEGCSEFQAEGTPRDLGKLITVGITTFLRKDSLERCLKSVRKFYPQLTIDVEDTEGNLSAGRNRSVARCRTPFFLLMEDDMEFTESTDLEALLDVVISDPDLIGCGCEVKDEKQRASWCCDWSVSNSAAKLIPTASPVLSNPTGTPYYKCQVISNFGIFRTEALQSLPWDEGLPLGEHRAWFFSWRDTWRVGYCLSCSVKHHQDRDGGEYDKHRDRAKEFLQLADSLSGVHFATSEVVQPPLGLCVVVMGVGHSNTTITTKQIATLLGLSLGDADDEFAESVQVRELNTKLLDEQLVKFWELQSAVQSLGCSWIVKDPRFCSTLDRWIGAMATYKPVLVWVQKDLDLVRESYKTRGQSSKSVDAKFALCQKQFDGWPWAKLILDTSKVEQIVEMFDVERSQQEPTETVSIPMTSNINKHGITWAYGVTTVPSRFENLLPRTLASLEQAGFPQPRLFVDGGQSMPAHLSGYEATFHDPKVNVFGNWALAAWELYLRNPSAQRYAIFQDDFVTYRNLRQYLESCPYPETGYLNLYTFPHNMDRGYTRQEWLDLYQLERRRDDLEDAIQHGKVPMDDRLVLQKLQRESSKLREDLKARSVLPTRTEGWYLSDQFGKGAVALVFSNEALRVLLRQKHFVDRPTDAHRGWRAVDGGIVTAMQKAGWQEYVHNPSLVQHTGTVSAMGNKTHLQANTFRGETFDARELVCEKKKLVAETVARATS